MNRTRTIPNDSAHDVVSFDILIEGEAINPAYQIMSITVDKAVNRIPTACIVIRDGEAAEETFELSNTDQFVPGKKIVIKAGRDSENEVVFKGIIIRHGIEVRKNGNSNLIIECKDEAVRMTIGRRNRYHENRTDSQVFEELIGDYNGLTPDVEDTGFEHKEIVQHHTTDWDFMLLRADFNGKLVMVDDGTIQIKAPDTSQDPVLSLLYGSTIYGFEAQMDARTQWGSVKASSWDYAGQDLFESEATSADFTEHGNIAASELAEVIGLDAYELRHSGHLLSEELQTWAEACMLKSRLSKIRGRAHVLTGKAELKPGTMIDLQGVGERFSGKAFVTAIRHEIGKGEWDSQIQFGLCPESYANRSNIADYQAAGTIPSINGLQIGKVVQLQDDPDGEDRILVKLPIIDAQASGIWCRIARLDAGENRATFFLPEIDDEVIVGFLNNDPRDAVVLGMLNSSAKPAPITAQDANDEKGIFTRSQMRIHFDDGQKIITIDTPAGNTIILDEAASSIIIEDQNSNKIEMSSSGIDISSPKNINLKAGQAISIEAGTNLDIKATNLSASASGPLKLEGATTKLAAQGINTISGSLVKIN